MPIRLVRWIRLAAFVITIGAFLMVSSSSLWGEPLLAFGDLAAYPRDASVFLESFQDAWSDRGLGGPGSASPAYLLSAVLVAITGGNDALAQKLYFLGWIPCAFAAMYWFMQRHLRVGMSIALVTALLFLTTPIIIGLMVAGATGLIWSYALLPLLFSAASSLSARRGQSWWWFALALSVFTAFQPELLVFGVLIAIVWSLPGESSLRVARGFALALLVTAVATLPAWLGRLSGTEIYPDLVDKAIEDVRYTYADVTPMTLARLAGNRGDPMAALGYNDGSPWTIWGFLVPMAAVLGLVLPGSSRVPQVRLLAIASIAVFALLTIGYLGQHYPRVLIRLPAALIFRNPQKLSLLLAATLIPCAGLGVQRLWSATGARHRLAVLIAGLALLVGFLVSYARPALEGDWGLRRVRGDGIRPASVPLAASRYLRAADPSLGEDWRVMWIPFSYDTVLTLQWILPGWPNDPVLENTDSHVLGLTRLLAPPRTADDLRLFHFLADRASVRYIVLGARHGDGQSDQIRRVLDADPRLSRYQATRDYVIWRNDTALPRVHSFGRLVRVAAIDTGSPIRYLAEGTLVPNAAPIRSLDGWFTYPAADFEVLHRPHSQRAIVGVRTSLTSEWPILRRRIRVRGQVPYRLTARIRLKDAADAHMRVIWYRDKVDAEDRAIRQDIATPHLSGTLGWTTVASDVLMSPPGARYADVVFLAGKRRKDSQLPASSFISRLSLQYTYEGKSPSITPEEAIRSIGDHAVVPSHSEIVADLGRPSRASATDQYDVLLLNPTAESLDRFEPAIRASEYVTLLSEASVRFQPTDGLWRLTGSDRAAATAIDFGEGEFSLPILKGITYRVSIVGCDIDLLSASLTHSSWTMKPPPADESRGCRTVVLGVVRGSERATLRLQVGPGSSLRGLVLYAHTRSQVRSESPSVSAESGDGSELTGVVLADAYHSGWRMSESGSNHLQSILGFNLFVGGTTKETLIFGPQGMRNATLFVAGGAWLLLIALAVVGRIRSKRAERTVDARATPPHDAGA